MYNIIVLPFQMANPCSAASFCDPWFKHCRFLGGIGGWANALPTRSCCKCKAIYTGSIILK